MRSQHGNALFLILIAVALFAALSYAVTSSSRGGGTIDREQVQLCLAQIDGHFKSMEDAITRIKAQGYADHQIDSFSTIYRTKAGGALGAANASCPDNDCRLFADRGGYVAPVVLPDQCLDLTDTFFTGSAAAGHFQLQTYRIPGIGTQTENSLYALTTRVSDQVCREYNRRAGFTIPATMTGSTWFGNRTDPSGYSGTLAAFPPDSGEDFALLGVPATVPTNGRPAFCWTLDTATATRAILYLVLQR